MTGQKKDGGADDRSDCEVGYRCSPLVIQFTTEQVDLIKRTICKGATNDECNCSSINADAPALTPSPVKRSQSSGGTRTNDGR